MLPYLLDVGRSIMLSNENRRSYANAYSALDKEGPMEYVTGRLR